MVTCLLNQIKPVVLSSHRVQYNNDILKKVSEGDEGAFAELFDEYKDSLYTLVLKITQSAIAAEDVLQEVFLRIWLHRSELHAIENFQAYIAVVTRRVVLNEIRKQNRVRQRHDLYQQSLLPQGMADALDGLQEKQHLDALHKSLTRLPPQQAAVFRLIKLQGLSREEAAVELRVSPETVKKHLGKAVRTVRAFLLVHLDDRLLISFLFVIG